MLPLNVSTQTDGKRNYFSIYKQFKKYSFNNGNLQ